MAQQPDIGVDPPDMVEEPENAVYCFLSGDRPCAAECAAYKTFPEDNKNLDTHQRHCLLLQSAERSARSLNVIAGLINMTVTKQKRAEADAKREKAFDSSHTPPATGTKA